jgi:hypothetical protein
LERAGYKPLTEVMPKGKMEKTIGFEAPDGTKWFGAKTNGQLNMVVNIVTDSSSRLRIELIN